MNKTERLIKLFENAGLNLLETINQIEDEPDQRQMVELLIKIDEVIQRLVSQAGDLAADIISEEYATGAREAIKGMIDQGMSGSSLSTSIRSVIHVRAVQAIVDESFYSILEATEHMTRDVKQRIEEAVKRANERNLFEGIIRRQATKIAVAELAQKQITGMVAKNGAQIPADKYMSGVIHYHQRKAHVTGAENKIVESGFDLVYVNRVGITCDICARYQGRVYSISGRDPRFPRLERRPPYHSHCVHSLSAWIEEYKTTDELTEMLDISNKPFQDTRTEQQIKRYEELQREKSRKNETRKQWIRYKSVLPNVTPDLKAFASHKARDSAKYKELGGLYRAANEQIKRTTPHFGIITPKNATIPDPKLLNYALDPNHETGKHKAIVFESALGYNQGNYKDLIDNVMRNLSNAPAYFKGSTAYGDKYEVVMSLAGPNGKSTHVLTAWMNKNGEARLTSIYVKN